MEPIQDVDLKRVNDNAVKAFARAAEARLVDYLRGLLVMHHNLQMKAGRLRREAEQADAQAQKIKENIDAIRAGSWSAVEPLEMSAGGAKEEK